MVNKLSCHDMKKGETYMCETCGIELQVLKEGKESLKPGETDSEHPGFECCGKPLTLEK
jgi:hypothetical protein